MSIQITIPGRELFDEAQMTFVSVEEVSLQLEHSLLSVSKWEAKWHKSFLSSPDITPEQLKDYVRCMTLNKAVPPGCYNYLTHQNMADIQAYIGDSMTATTITQRKQRKSRQIITSELIYSWMVEFGIPFECEKWHLNRLMTLIEVCSIHNSPGKKMSRKEQYAWMRSMNDKRRAALGTKG